MELKRCSWVNLKNPLYVAYHDSEWSVPIHDDQKLFEFIVLESAQAGLSWEIILKKREGYRKAFKQFDVRKVSKMTNEDISRLMNDVSIVRNRLKISATIGNAQNFLKIQKDFGSFDAYIWKWVNFMPILSGRKSITHIPNVTHLAEIIAKDLKVRGFKFLGPTIMYAYMQAIGMANDHTTECFRYHKK
jgi:DNA-3-methyladenine glycosylase I